MIAFSTISTANTGAGLTLNVNSLGAKSVAKWQGTTTLVAGDVPVSKPVQACYDGTNWNLATIGNAPTGSGNTTSTSLTTGYLPKASGANAIVNSGADDGITLANVFSYSGTGGYSGASYSTTGSNGGITGTEGTGAGLTAAASKDLLYPDSAITAGTRTSTTPIRDTYHSLTRE